MPDVIQATTVSMKTLTDGTLRAVIQIEPYHLKDWVNLGLGESGVAVAVARLTERAQEGGSVPDPGPATDYGREAEKLWTSGFLFHVDVCSVLGSDEEFLNWIRQKECCVNMDGHSGDIVAAHVRRVADGSGMGIKPEYSALPMCDGHHHQQHQQGYGAVLEGGKDGAQAMVRQYRRRWGWGKLREIMEVPSMKLADPLDVRAWAEENNLDRYLPQNYGVCEEV